MEIITGYTGIEHVTSADDASFHRGILGQDDYVLDIGSKFEATIIDNNTIKISDGDLVIQGHQARIRTNDYEEVTINNGVIGKKRHDFIVARYEKNTNTGLESITLEVLEGEIGDNGQDPAITEGDIATGDTIVEYPLYRVKLDSLNITEIEQLFKVGNNLEDLGRHLRDISTHTKTVRVTVGTSTAGWTEKNVDYLCDGVADEDEINTALGELVDGGEVVLLDGTYNLTANAIVFPYHNITLRGNGNSTIIKRGHSGGTLIRIEEKKGCKVTNLQIEGDIANYSTSNWGVLIIKRPDGDFTTNIISDITIRNCEVGILLSGDNQTSSRGNIITNNACINCEIGIEATYSLFNIIKGNICMREPADYSGSQYTIRLQAGANNNIVVDNMCHGKDIVDNGKGNTLANNKFDGEVGRLIATDDGSYIKYEDGTMVCRGKKTVSISINTAWGSLFYGNVGKIPFPKPFIDYPDVSYTNKGARAIIVTSSSNNSKTQTGDIDLCRPTADSSNQSYTVGYVAVGNWK